MDKTKGNFLIVVEYGQFQRYLLDQKPVWEAGREEDDIIPDIKMEKKTISRRHGCFFEQGGEWYYRDYHSKNGTLYNGEKIEADDEVIHEQDGSCSVRLKDGDILVFGTRDSEIVYARTVFTMFLRQEIEVTWREMESKDYTEFVFLSGEEKKCFKNPPRGTVVRFENGIGIYMGKVTYLCGDITVKGR